jgi:hypothetical protein
MPDPEQYFLKLIDKAIADDPSLVVPADEDQLKRLADLLELDAVWQGGEATQCDLPAP